MQAMCVFIELFTRNLLFIDDRIWIIFQFSCSFRFQFTLIFIFFHTRRAHNAPAMIIMTLVTIKIVFSLVHVGSVNFFPISNRCPHWTWTLGIPYAMTTAFVNAVFHSVAYFFFKWLLHDWEKSEDESNDM